MAHYHFQDQRVVDCDTLTVNCSIEPRYSSLDAAMKYRGKKQPLGSDFRPATGSKSRRWDGEHPLLDLLELLALPFGLIASLFSSN